MTRNKARLMVLTAGILWGTSFPVIRLGLLYIGSFTFLSLRFVIASMMILALLKITGSRIEISVLLRDRFVWFTGILNAMGYTFQYIGQNYTYASNASLLVNTSPIFTAISAHYLLREKMTPKRIGAIILAFTGSAVIILDSYGRALTLGAVGDFFCLLSGFVWGLYVTYSKKAAVGDYDFFSLLAVWFSIVSLVSAPFIPLEYLSGRIVLNLVSLSIVVYTSIFCTVLAFFFWFKSLSYLEASTSSAYFMVEILVSMFLEFLMFSVVFTVAMVVGAVMVIVGVYLTDRFYESSSL